MNIAAPCSLKKILISSLPLLVRRFEGNESNQLGQLFVTLEMISTKIKMIKENKSPGPKLLKEI